MPIFEARGREGFTRVRVRVEAEDRKDAKWKLHHGSFQREDAPGESIDGVWVDMRTIREVKPK